MLYKPDGVLFNFIESVFIRGLECIHCAFIRGLLVGSALTAAIATLINI